jgi:hypothetical protein
MTHEIQSLKNWCARDRIRTCTPRLATEAGESKSPASANSATRAQTEGRPSGHGKPRRPPRFLRLPVASRNCKPSPIALLDAPGDAQASKCGPYGSLMDVGKHGRYGCAGLSRHGRNSLCHPFIRCIGSTAAAAAVSACGHGPLPVGLIRQHNGDAFCCRLLEGSKAIGPPLLVSKLGGLSEDAANFVGPIHWTISV